MRTKMFGLDLLPSSPDLAGANVELVKMPWREFRLKEVLKKISRDYDVIIDSPPFLGLPTLHVPTASHKVIILI